jgi:xanthine/uracil permease
VREELHQLVHAPDDATCGAPGAGSLRRPLQSWGQWKIGSRLPFVMLPGGAPIVLFLGIAKEYDIRTAVGAVILAAAFYFVALPVFARLLKYFPTVVIGTMIVIIGVNLIRVSGLLITGQPGSPGFGHRGGVLLALTTIGCTVLFFRVLHGGLAQLSVLLGLVAGTILAFATGAVGRVGDLATGPVLGVPALRPFGAPRGENIGIVRVRWVRSRFVTLGAGLILIVIGVVAPNGRAISLIPAPVVGGTAVVAYSIVLGLGIQLLRKVDFHQQSNMVIAAVALAVGLLPILIPGLYDQFPGDRRILLGSGVAMTAFTAAILNPVFHHLGGRSDRLPDDITAIRQDEQHTPAAQPAGAREGQAR